MKYLLYFLFFFTQSLQSQTVGVLTHSPDVYYGYTLLAPSSTDFVYLIDVCGRVVHKWDTTVRPGLRTSLAPDGTLIRTARKPGSFFGGGIGGEILGIDWEGNIIWRYTFANEQGHLHHDIDVMPNGNVLAIAWEKIDEDDAIQMGRNPSNVNSRGIWPDHVIEYNPVLDSIVWSWHVKDHLVQEFDPSKDNYAAIADHPELIDINLNGTLNGDWNHINAINYNSELDQIVLSSRTFDEIWIIDHSTTTEEAKGSTGGRWGKGGDLLYRWGNPQNYGRGTIQDKELFGQHDIRWIKSDAPDGGKLMVYNNGSNRPGGQYSSIEIIDAPTDTQGNYVIEDSLAYGPISPNTVISGNEDPSFYSDRISGANQMPNGNILVCVGLEGRFLEFNEEKELLWEYVNPLDGSTPVAQGEIPFSIQIFKTERYSEDYPAFEGKDLIAADPLEINPDIDDCLLLTDTKELDNPSLFYFPNPASQSISIVSEVKQEYKIYNTSGYMLQEGMLHPGTNQIDLAVLANGMYFVQASNKVVKLVVEGH